MGNINDFSLQYNKKPIDVKLTNLLRFKLISMGLSFTDAFITENSDVNKFCKCWSVFLNEPYNPEKQEEFLSGFSTLELLNTYYISILYRDGILDKDSTESEEEKTKKKVG